MDVVAFPTDFHWMFDVRWSVGGMSVVLLLDVRFTACVRLSLDVRRLFVGCSLDCCWISASWQIFDSRSIFICFFTISESAMVAM